MNLRWLAGLLVIVASLSFAQTESPKINLSTNLQLKILKTQRQIFVITGKQQELNQKYQKLLQEFNQTPAVKDLQTQADIDMKQLQESQAAIEQTKTEAFKEANLDPKQYSFDVDSMSFTPKPPEKK